MSYVNSFDTLDEALLACVEYNPNTGNFFWKYREEFSWVDSRFNKTKAGTEILNICANGYKRVSLYYNSKQYDFKAHRFAWLSMTGYWPDGILDHVDGDTLNNKWYNLRQVTYQQNTWNRTTPKTSKTGHKGVDIVKGKFRARGFKDGERVVLGTFPTKEEAIKAYESFTKGFQDEYYRV